MAPAWWAIRGLAIGLWLTWSWAFPGRWGTDEFRLVALAGILVAIGLSMRLGALHTEAKAWKWLAVAATIVGLIAAASVAGNISRQVAYYEIEEFPGVTTTFPTASLAVPDVTGLTVREAIEEATEAGFEVAVQGLTDDGIVMYQIPSPGEAVPEGTVLIIAVPEATQPVYLVVPDLIGLSVNEAIDAAIAAGFAVEVEDPTADGPVEAQTPLPGEEVPEGTVVIITAP